jgi:hypothetical protein
MGGELARRRANVLAERQQSFDLDSLRRRVDLADAEIMALGHVTREAIQETTMTSLVFEQACQIAPSGAELYRLQAWAGGIEMAEVIRGVRHRW